MNLSPSSQETIPSYKFKMNALMSTTANSGTWKFNLYSSVHKIKYSKLVKVLVAKQQSTSDLLPGKCELTTHLRLVYKHKVKSLVL